MVDVSRKRILALVAVLVAIGCLALLRRRSVATDARPAHPRARENLVNERVDRSGTERRSSGKALKSVDHRGRTSVRPKRVPDAASVVTIDQLFPGIADKMVVNYEAYFDLHRAVRKCRVQSVPDLERVQFEAVLKFERRGESHHLADVEVTSPQPDVDEYVRCVRDSYLDIALEISAPFLVPDVFYLKDEVHRGGDQPVDLVELRARIVNLNTAFEEAEDEFDRAMILEIVTYYECLEERGLDHRVACASE